MVVSIKEKTVAACLEAMKGEKCVEIRLEEMKIGNGELKKLFGHKGVETIATCRLGKISDAERKARLLEAIGAGAAYVDVEVDASDDVEEAVVAAAKKAGCKVIVSFHDYEKTPLRPELEKIIDWCFESGADIAKIACKVNSDADAARLLGLLESKKKLAVVGMGQKGRLVRIVAPLLGSCIAFASKGKGKETADGQMTKEEMEKIMGALGSV